MEEIEVALREAQAFGNKQTVGAERTVSLLDQMLGSLQQLRSELSKPGLSAEEGRNLVQTTVSNTNWNTEIANTQKELHAWASKLSKVVEKCFVADVCKAYIEDLALEQEILNKVSNFINFITFIDLFTFVRSDLAYAKSR